MCSDMFELDVVAGSATLLRVKNAPLKWMIISFGVKMGDIHKSLLTQLVHFRGNKITHQVLSPTNLFSHDDAETLQALI